MMYKVDTGMGGLPLVLSCYSNGQISVKPSHRFKPIVEDLSGTMLVIYEEGIAIGKEVVLEYGVAANYQNHPLLVKWLQQQNLVAPQF